MDLKPNKVLSLDMLCWHLPIICGAICQLFSMGDLHNILLFVPKDILGHPPLWPASGGPWSKILGVDGSQGTNRSGALVAPAMVAPASQTAKQSLPSNLDTS